MIAVKNPHTMHWAEVTDDFGCRALILEVSAGKDMIAIQASPERWESCIKECLSGRFTNQEEVLRGMYVRGEIEIDELEKRL